MKMLISHVSGRWSLKKWFSPQFLEPEWSSHMMASWTIKYL
jgi:hypothetical protein